jgi:hypothetical protein
MTTRTWIGGGNNRANNPKDWSPNGLPAAGDLLVATSGTMNVQGNELGGPGTLGLSTLQLNGNVDVKLSQNANVMPIDVEGGAPRIDVTGTAKFMLSTSAGSATVNLAANSAWVGNFSAFTGTTRINGNSHAQFITNSEASGATEINGSPAYVVINANIGKGSSEIDAMAGASIEVGGSVADGQLFAANAFSSDFGLTLSKPGVLKIDHPAQFAGAVKLGVGEIDLVGLAGATSWSFARDILSIYSGANVIDKITVHQTTSLAGSAVSGAIAVERTSAGVAIFRSGEPHAAGTVLPFHP